jgi:NADP-dependent 3-hydroxy acid dehydrogenase YdfG
MMSKPLSQHVFFITGASQGIGAAVAAKAAELGAQCILLARTSKALETLATGITTQGHREPIRIPLDLLQADPEMYRNVVTQLSEHVDKLDALYHFAAHPPKLTPIEHYDIRHWFEVMQVNCHATFLLTQSLLPLLKAAPAAKIVFAQTDYKPAYWGAHHCATAARNALQEVLAEELENSRVTTHNISPAATATAFRRRAFPGETLTELLSPEQAAEEFLALWT